MPSKLQKGLVKTNLKPSSAGINNVPTIVPPTTQLQITTNTDPTKTKLPLKTNVDVMNKTSPVSSLLPTPKSNISYSSIANDLSPTKRNSTKPSRQASLLKRKNDDSRTQFSRNVRVAPFPHNRKSIIQTPKYISKNMVNKKAKAVQQPRISKKKSTSSIEAQSNVEIKELRTENTKLLSEVEKLRLENEKLQAEKKELMQEKGLLTADVCQMEHRLACEDSRVIELEEEVADLRKQCSILKREHDQIDRDRVHFRNELDIANNLIIEQATTMSDQQALIEELMTQIDEQERVCQDLQNAIDTFKTNHALNDKTVSKEN
ncbi:13302_t:CDS:1 [Funneliformis mosseae]|uniref:13302_t:CDS:1 n=1 Tax=Funneliformis mosseae TaxID=27381 RepID=A0A9N9G9X5_FUNMO|nr:13302_t:CDS:1 [Funneliformis mosseae]